jgi:phosphatidylglycerol:prolipoprotein diacylglycerol transferase
VLIVSGIIAAYVLGAREEKRLGLAKDSMLDMVLVAVPCGIVGARLYYVLMSLDQFRQNPVSALYVWEGGVAIYGAVIGGALGVWIHSRIKKRSFASLLDIAAPGLALAQAIGRWGNYFNREAYGPVITDAAWRFFPAGVLIEEGGAPVWHAATFFYESMWNLLVFAVLWVIRKRMKRRGDLFLWYIAMYGAGRFLVEQLRADSLYLFGFRVSQYLSLLLCLTVAVVFLLRLAKARGALAALPALLACAIPFGRALLPAGLPTALILLAMAVACGALLLSDGDRPRFACWWLLADTVVYAVLLLFKLNWLWHSPYFFYAGLSLPPYLAIAYAARPKPAPQAQPTEG